MGVQIVGVGFDSPEENQAWAEEEVYAFEIWTDDDKTLALTYGSVESKSEGTPGRVTMLLDASGELALEYKVSLNLGTHPEEVLSDARALFSEAESDGD